MKKLIALILFAVITFIAQAQIQVHEPVSYRGIQADSCYLKVIPYPQMNDTVIVVAVYPYASKQEYIADNTNTVLFNEIPQSKEFIYHRETDGSDIRLFVLTKVKEVLISENGWSEGNITIEE